MAASEIPTVWCCRNGGSWHARGACPCTIGASGLARYITTSPPSSMTAIGTRDVQSRDGRGRSGMWPLLAICISLIPVLPGLSNTRVFYIRDLSLYFWGRYLWLRRAWLAGEWPLWDPFVGAGQAAYSDPLNQMFLPPAILARLMGGEAFGFNLWVALPFPLAALGAWL